MKAMQPIKLKLLQSFSRDLQRALTELRQSIQQMEKRVIMDMDGVIVGDGIMNGPVFTPKRLKTSFRVSEGGMWVPKKIKSSTNCKIGKIYCKPGTVCKPIEGSFCTECELCNKFN